MDLDYERYGRQIVLPEVGPAGQRRLAACSVRFVGAGEPQALAERLHEAAGGTTAPGGEAGCTVCLPALDPASGEAAVLGVAAWAAVEAARRVLGGEPRALPPALLARLGARVPEDAPR
jgi:hypothetical protein